MIKKIDKMFGYIGIILIILLGTLAISGLLSKSDIFVIPTRVIFGILLLFVLIYVSYIGLDIIRK